MKGTCGRGGDLKFHSWKLPWRRVFSFSFCPRLSAYLSACLSVCLCCLILLFKKTSTSRMVELFGFVLVDVAFHTFREGFNGFTTFCFVRSPFYFGFVLLMGSRTLAFPVLKIPGFVFFFFLWKLSKAVIAKISPLANFLSILSDINIYVI